MAKRTIEIDDDLDERVDYCKKELLENFREFLKENPDIDEFDTYYQKKGCDSVHEIVDSNTPIYYSNINALYYLYGDEFDEAYKNAGIGDGTENNHRQVAIYCYLEQKTFDYMRDTLEEELFPAFIEKKTQLEEKSKSLTLSAKSKKVLINFINTLGE